MIYCSMDFGFARGANKGGIKMSVTDLKEHTEAIMYKEMYLTMARAARDANRILTEAMQKCEDMYINAHIPQSMENDKDTQ